MSKTLFTADLHFGHVNILEYAPQRRDFLGLSDDADVNDMNEALVELWNRQVDPYDEVQILGDFAMGRIRETIQYAKRLNGYKFLTLGNHDRPHPINFKSEDAHAEWVRLYVDAGFMIHGTGPFIEVLDGVTCAVSHFPYEGDHSDTERYGEWRPDDHGLPLVHGHIHDLWATSGRMYNVGIDAWDGVFQTPEQIADYFRSQGFNA